MAVITTIIDVYNVISAIIEKAKEIFEMLDKVLDGFADLIKGVLDAAATVFEKALGAAIPVVMAILASLFGLDDAADEVKKAIEKLRVKVKEGVKKVLNAIKGLNHNCCNDLSRCIFPDSCSLIESHTSPALRCAH